MDFVSTIFSNTIKWVGRMLYRHLKFNLMHIHTVYTIVNVISYVRVHWLCKNTVEIVVLDMAHKKIAMKF